MSARDGRGGEGGKAMEDKEAREGGGEIILRRDGEGKRKNKTSCVFFILHSFHCNSIVELITSMREKFQPKAGLLFKTTSTGGVT